MPRNSLALLIGAVFIGAVSAFAAPAPAPPVKAYPSPPVLDEPERMSVKEARRAIVLLDRTYQSALRQIHRRFPVGNGQPVVAAVAVRDIQREVSSSAGVSSRFLAVGTKAMNPDHEPKDAFEREAVQELKRGSRWVEAQEDGRLRVATGVPLGGGCFPCHSTPAGNPVQAAISWSVPVLLTQPEPAVRKSSTPTSRTAPQSKRRR
jgi:hypothetical protein